MEEEKTVRKLLKKIVYLNDQKAARAFFNHFYEPLINFSMFYLGSIELAEDVVSDVFLKLFKNKKRLLKIRDIRFYLYKSVKNQSTTYLKRLKRKRSLDLDIDDFRMEEFILDSRTPEDEYLSKELRAKVQKSIQSLPKQRRVVYQLITEDKLKYKEAAELLGLSVKTVDNHLTLAIKQIRKRIDSYLDSEYPIENVAGK